MKLSAVLWVGAVAMSAVIGDVQYAAQVAVLGLTCAIFFGTLKLKRPGRSQATTTQPG